MEYVYFPSATLSASLAVTTSSQKPNYPRQKSEAHCHSADGFLCGLNSSSFLQNQDFIKKKFFQ
jgi:hypothetical protein